MNFYETVAGKRFFESQLPKLISALQEIAQGLHQAPSVIPFPLDTQDILHDLFYGQYEPYFERPNTEEYQDASRKISAYLECLRAELPPEHFSKAVQLFLCGLRTPGHMVKEDLKYERENI